MAFFENGAAAHGELATAGGAFFQTMADNAFGIFLARLGAHADQDIKLFHAAAVRAHGTVRPTIASRRSKAAFSSWKYGSFSTLAM